MSLSGFWLFCGSSGCAVCSGCEDGFGEVAVSELVQMRKVSVHASLCLSLFLFSLSSTEVRTLYLIARHSYRQGRFKCSPKAPVFTDVMLFRRGGPPAPVCSRSASHQLLWGCFSSSLPGCFFFLGGGYPAA